MVEQRHLSLSTHTTQLHMRMRSARRSRRSMLPNEALLIWNEINRKCLCVFASLVWCDCNGPVCVEVSWWRIDSLTFSVCRLYIMNEWNWVCRKWASRVWMPHRGEESRQADGRIVGRHYNVLESGFHVASRVCNGVECERLWIQLSGAKGNLKCDSNLMQRTIAPKII